MSLLQCSINFIKIFRYFNNNIRVWHFTNQDY